MTLPYWPVVAVVLLVLAYRFGVRWLTRKNERDAERLTALERRLEKAEQEHEALSDRVREMMR